MKWFITEAAIQSELAAKIKEYTGENVRECYQCGKCSAGCPMSYEMDILPNQVIRMVQLGMKEQVLSSKTIWLCASCFTCTVRCPRSIDIAGVIDYLRQEAHRTKVVPKNEIQVSLFNQLFIRNVETFGRLYEMGLVGIFNLLTGDFFKDLFLLPRVFRKGKISLFPRRAKDLRKTREIIKRSFMLEKTDRGRAIDVKAIFFHLRGKIFGRKDS